VSKENVLLSAYSYTANVAGTERFVTLAKGTLQLFGKSLAQRLSPSDQPGLYVPMKVVRGGKEQPGAVLTLADRAVVGWSEGILRPKPHTASIQLDSISGVEEVTKPGNVHSVPLPMFYVHAEDEWTFVSHNVYAKDGPDIPQLLVAALLGALTFDYALGEEPK